jgi:hypothetical protein
MHPQGHLTYGTQHNLLQTSFNSSHFNSCNTFNTLSTSIDTSFTRRIGVSNVTASNTSILRFTLCNHHPCQDIGITLQTTSVLASKNIFQTKLGQTISPLLFDSTSPQKYGKQVQHNLNGSDISPRSKKIALLQCRMMSL